MPTLQGNPVAPPTGFWGRIKVSFTMLCTLQGLYYLLTGIWPLLGLDSFEAVTGKKYDDWLVKTVACLVLIDGAVFLLAAWRRSTAPEVTLLAVGSAIMLTLVDIVYVSERTISAVYLLDAVLEIGLVIGWMRYLMAERRAGLQPPATPPRGTV
jgi:hypothetical protein